MKLSTGWNPYFMGEDSRLYTPLKEVVIKYKQEVERTTRKDTYDSYCSFLEIFCEWIEKQSPNIYSSMITHALIAKFMDYVYNERKGRKTERISNRTYNNYIKNGSAFFTWMIDKCYCKLNLQSYTSNCYIFGENFASVSVHLCGKPKITLTAKKALVGGVHICGEWKLDSLQFRLYYLKKINFSKNPHFPH